MALAICFSLLGAAPPPKAPLVGRPSEHFYGAVGEQVRIALIANQTVVKVEDPFVLTLSITGSANPEMIQRPDLRVIPDYSSRFHIDDIPDESAANGQRVFRYQLRPKSEKATEVPPLIFHYWNPRRNYFATTATRELVALRVVPRQPPMAAGGPIRGPDFLLESLKEEDFERRPTSDRTIALRIAAFLLIAASVFGIWLRMWQWRNPSGARLAKMLRNRSVRQALDDLLAIEADPSPRDARVVAVVVLAFLQARVGLSPVARTADEVVGELNQLNLKPELIQQVELFLRHCEAERFGPRGASNSVVAAEARRLILSLESEA